METNPRQRRHAPRALSRRSCAGVMRGGVSPLWLVLIGLLLSFGMTLWQIKANRDRARDALNQAGLTLTTQLKQQLGEIELGLLGARGVWIGAGSEAAAPALFQQYAISADLGTRLPGISHLGYIQYTANSPDSPWWSYAAVDNASTGVALRPLSWPAAARQVALQSAQTQQMRVIEAHQLTPSPLPPLGGTASATAVSPLLYWLLPVYRHGTAPAATDQRLAATQGWVYVVMDPAAFLNALGLPEPGLRLRVVALDPQDHTHPVFESTRATSSLSTLPTSNHLVQSYGLHWQLQLEATSQFENAHQLRPTGLVSLACVLLTLIGSVLWQSWNERIRRRRAELVGISQLAEQRLDHVRSIEVREQAIVDQAQNSIIVTDTTGRILLFNPASERLLGYRASEVIGHKHLNVLFDIEELQRRVKTLSARLGRKLEPGEVFMQDLSSHGDDVRDAREWHYLHADGTRVPVFLTVGRLTDEHGQLSGFIGIASDLSERKKLEAELHEANAMAERTRQAEAANEARGQFLAHMSHEIRTPLNAIIGLTRLMKHTTLSIQQRDYMRKTMLASHSLLDLINDVLDLAKIDSGQLHITPAPMGLHLLLDEVLSVMETQAQAKEVMLRCECGMEVPACVQADAMRLRQVLINLIGNALKFTTQGEVVLSVQRHPLPPQPLPESTRVALRFAVRDTGIGISAEAQGRLFTPYIQAEDTTASRYGGTGLGLSIVKQLVNLMGGEVGLISSVGRGSEFWFTLVLPVCQNADIPIPVEDDGTPDGQRLTGVRVLLADDSDINREIGQRLLELEGAKVITARDGAEASLLAASIYPPVQVVLMDLHMPVLDGCEAARRIRSQVNGHKLPIIALTGGSEANEQVRAHAAGMNDYLTKPYDLLKLVRTIRRHLPDTARPDSTPASDAATPTVLCVDDAESNWDWPEAWTALPFVDAEAAAERVGGDLALYCRMLHALFNDPGMQLWADISTQAPDWSGDRRPWTAQWHKLHGATALLGLTHLHIRTVAAENDFATLDAAQCTQTVLEIISLLDEVRHTWLPMVEEQLNASNTTSAAEKGADFVSQVAENA